VGTRVVDGIPLVVVRPGVSCTPVARPPSSPGWTRLWRWPPFG